MIPYIIFIFVVSLLLYKANLEGKNRVFSLMGLLVVFCFTVFRFDVGYDYGPYYKLIENLNFNRIDEFTKWEPLHLLLIWLCKKVHFTALYMILITAFAQFCIMYSIIKYNRRNMWYLGMMAYLSMYYLTDMSTMRQAAAVGVIMCSFKFVAEKRLVPFLLCVLIAFNLHYSSICAILIYVIYNYVNKKNQLLYFALIIASFGFVHLLTLTHYKYYVTDFRSAGGDLLKYIYVFVVLILLFLYRTSKKYDSVVSSGFYVLLMGVFVPFILGGHIGARMQQYFFCVLFFMIPRIFESYNQRSRALFCVFFALLFLSQVYQSHINAVYAGKDQFIPYRTVFTVDFNYVRLK